MQFKEGLYWKACHDEETGRYFGEYGDFQGYHIYELTEEQFCSLDESMSEGDAASVMYEGRHMYMAVDDRCGPPYTIIFDDECRKLCPWAKFYGSRNTVWPDELTDAAVELFASEENNREQRRKKREEREKNKKGETEGEE